MNKQDKIRVLQGLVRLNHRWVNIETKVARFLDLRERLENGYVFFMGDWMPIEEKVERTRALQGARSETRRFVIHPPGSSTLDGSEDPRVHPAQGGSADSEAGDSVSRQDTRRIESAKSNVARMLRDTKRDDDSREGHPASHSID